jgi:pyruvate formate lyase activating enzyme
MSEQEPERPTREEEPEGSRPVSRRAVLKWGIGVALGAGALGGLTHLARSERTGPPPLARGNGNGRWVHPASYYEKLSNGFVRCELCPKRCHVGPGGRGFCEVRENQEGEYFTLVYGRAASVNVDPVEKKPFFHVLPGSPAFSFATAGCNMECKNCQNWQLSQARPEDIPAMHLPPEKLVEAARRQECPLIAGTYSEPTVFYEYMRDVAIAGNENGIRSTMVSAGLIAREPMRELCNHLAAVKIDLKSMRDEFYQSNCQGMLRPVLDTIELVKSEGVWLEIVYLVIPGMNDGEAEIRELSEWVRGHVGADTPLHFSRFHPQYKLTKLPPTPYETLDRCYQIAREEGLRYVYVGNLPGHPATTTQCPKCDKALVRRQNFQVLANDIRDGKCRFCGQPIPGVWS